MQSQLQIQSTRRLLRVYRSATDDQRSRGLSWYPRANADLRSIAAESGLSLDSVCGICAALSPAVGWYKNLADTAAIIADSNATVSTYGPNKAKAIRIKSGEAPLDVLGGVKVRAFYANLRNPDASGEVTIDRHAARAALPADANWQRAIGRKAERAAIVAAYHRAAELACVSVDGLQAVVWVAYRENTLRLEVA